MLLKFVAPLLHDADSRQRRGVAKRAERAAQHILGEIAYEIDIFGAAIACVKTVQHFAQPGGAFAAGDAPAAGFVRIKVHDAAGPVPPARVFLPYDQPAPAEEPSR